MHRLHTNSSSGGGPPAESPSLPEHSGLISHRPEAFPSPGLRPGPGPGRGPAHEPAPKDDAEQKTGSRRRSKVALSLQPPVIEQCDVLVAGGGPAGTMAAIAAARRGARVVLLERLAALGGNLTAGLVNPMLTFHARSGLQVVQGLAQELVDRLIDAGGSPGHVPDPVAFVKTVTPFDADALKWVLDDMVQEAGVRVYFHTQVLAVIKDGQTITHVAALAGKQGVVAFHAPVFIDATGDGDLASFAGEPWHIGRENDGQTQPMTMMFRMVDVDEQRVRQYVAEHPDDFYMHGQGMLDGAYVGVAGFYEAVAAAVASGELPPHRDRILFFGGTVPGEVLVNVTRVIGATVLDAQAWSKAEMSGRNQVRLYSDFLKRRIPGFEHSRTIQAAQQLGIRESRRPVGRYVLQAADLIRGVPFVDAIASGSYPVDIHSPSDEGLTVQALEADYYFIPYRSLLAQNTPNLLYAGRAISATHEATAAIRVSPIAMAIGEAAGAAAALASADGTDPGRIDVKTLQTQLTLPPGPPAPGNG